MLSTIFQRSRPILPVWLVAISISLASWNKASATSVPPENLIAWLYGQPVGFDELQRGGNLLSGDHLVASSTIQELKVQLPTSQAKEGQLSAGSKRLPFTIASKADKGDYFVFDSVAFDQWMNEQFPELLVPVAEGQGYKLYSYAEMKKQGEKRFKLSAVLKQIGISVSAEKEGDPGKEGFADLDNFRDAIGSSIVKWVISMQEGSLLYLDEGRLRALPLDQVRVLEEGEGVLAGTYEVNKFTPPAEPRTEYLWLFIGMVAGGGIMGLVVMVIGKGKRKEGANLEEDELEKLKEAADRKANSRKEDDPQDALRKVKGALDENGEEDGLGKLKERPEKEQEKSGFAELLNALNVQSEDEEGDEASATLRTMQQVLETVAVEMKGQGSAEGHEYMMDFRRQLSDWVPAIEGLKLMAEMSDADQALSRAHAIRSEMEKDKSLSVLPADESRALQNLETVLRNYKSLQKKLQTPDPARSFLTELEKRYGGLSSDLGKMHDEPTDEERVEWTAKVIKLALHLSDFMRVYLDKPHSDTTKLNLHLIKTGKLVTDLGSDQYRSFTEGIDRVPRTVRNLRFIARKAGVRSLDDVLVEGYHIPPSALQE